MANSGVMTSRKVKNKEIFMKVTINFRKIIRSTTFTVLRGGELMIYFFFDKS